MYQGGIRWRRDIPVTSIMLSCGRIVFIYGVRYAQRAVFVNTKQTVLEVTEIGHCLCV